jgi:tripartite ATP-independent transporter DctP family solute receptor
MVKSKKLFLVLLVMVLSLTVFGSVDATRVIRIGHIMNVDQPHHLALVKFAEFVEKQTKGAIEVKILPNSQMGNALTQMQSVKMGTLDGFIDGVGWYGQLVGDYYLPATAFLFKDWDQCIKVMKGPIGQEMADKLLKQHGLKVLDQNWLRLPRQLLSRKPIQSVADVKGLKLRIPELTSYIVPWKQLGASPTPIAFAEVYLALQQGVVDAMECPIDMIYTQKLHEVAKYLILTSHQAEPGGFIMNARLFNGFTSKEQKIILKAAKQAGEYNNKLTLANEKTIADKMQAEGVTFIKINRQEFVEAAKKAPLLLEEKGLWPKGLYERAMKVK